MTLRVLLPLFLLTLGTFSAKAAQERFYLGTYTDHTSSKGIYLGTLDSDTGKLGPLTLAGAAIDPSFVALSPDGRNLYAAEETQGTGQVQAFSRRRNGSLSALDTMPANGNGTCHLAVDPSDRDVLIANYGTGTIACFRLQPNGSLGARSATARFTGSGPDKSRQEGPHAHSIYVSPDDAYVYSCDLGTDHVWIYKLNSAAGTLTPAHPAFAQVPAGSGPRHLAFSRDGKFVYVCNEMGHSVTVFNRHSGDGSLTPLETVSTLQPGTPQTGITTAEIVLHPSGRWLYVSNRGCETISVFALAPDGRAELIQAIHSPTKFPRGFDLDPTGRWIITAGQKDGRITVLKVDPSTGLLTPTDQSATVGSPVCVLFENKRQSRFQP